MPEGKAIEIRLFPELGLDHALEARQKLKAAVSRYEQGFPSGVLFWGVQRRTNEVGSQIQIELQLAELGK